jgi:hypothetical protein
LKWTADFISYNGHTVTAQVKRSPEFATLNMPRSAPKKMLERKVLIQPREYLIHPGTMAIQPADYLIHPGTMAIQPADYLIHPGNRNYFCHILEKKVIINFFTFLFVRNFSDKKNTSLYVLDNLFCSPI